MTRTHVRTRVKDIAEVIELNRHIKTKTLLKKYRIVGNFQRRKLSRISRRDYFVEKTFSEY